MKSTHPSPLLVAVIGIVLSLLAIGGIGFFLIKPALDSITIQQARYDANAPDARPEVQAAAKQSVADAKLKVQMTKMQWAQKEAALMPPYDVSNRYKALRQLTYELTRYLGPDLERQLTVGPVNSNTNIALPPPPVSPNDITNAPVVIPLGTISVTGDFRHILTHFYDWQYFNRLVVVDNLALDGNSPYMQGTYNATLYIFPQNDDKVPVTIPQAGVAGATAGSSGGGGGGYPGGGGGGYPGGGYPGGKR